MRTDAAAFARLVGWGYFPLAFVGRLPFAMMIIGVLTLVATVRESVAEAGIAAAFAGIGTALLGPTIGSLADRLGEAKVLVTVSVINLTMIGLFLAVTFSGATLLLVAAVAALLGGTTPQVAPFSRSRLAGVASRAGTPERRERAVSAVMSYESAVDETSFVVGPVLVGVLSTFLAPWAPLALAAVLTALVIISFALHPSGRRMPVPRASTSAPGASAFSPRILVLALAMALVGAIFGTILTALTEFMRGAGGGEQTGIVYGAMSLGAILVAVVVAVLPARFTLELRAIVFALLGVAGAILLANADSILAVVVALFLSGCGVGAVLVTLFSMGAKAAPEGRTATVMTTLQSALVVGQALAAVAGGFLAQAAGASGAFWGTATVAVALVVVVVIHRATVGAPRSMAAGEANPA